MFDKYENKAIGYLKNKPVYYDNKIGYAIEEDKMYIRTPTHKEMRQIKAKFGELEKRCKKWNK